MERRNHKKQLKTVALVIGGVLAVSQLLLPLQVMAGELGAENTQGQEQQENPSAEPSTSTPATENNQNAGQATDATEAPVTEAPIVIPEIPEEEDPTHAPKIIVSGCSANVEQIEPGTDVTFSVSLRNTSKDVPVYNMKVTYESASGELLPMETTNSKYINSLGAGASTGLSFSMHIPKDISSFSQRIIINMEYEDEDTMSYSSSESVFINIFRPLGFHADNPVVPEKVESGTTATITMNMFNTGKAPIYNVRCKLECRGFLESGTYYIGNIDPESSVTATLMPTASNRNYGPLGDPNTAKYGTVLGKIVITYEDEDGTEYTEEVNSVRTEITAPPEEIKEPEIQEVKYSSQWWVSIVVLLVVIDGLIIFAAYYFRKHRV